MFRSDAAPTTSQGYPLALDSRYRANSLTFVDIYERGWKVAALRQQAITPSQSCRCGTHKSNWSRMRAACRKAVSVRLPGGITKRINGAETSTRAGPGYGDAKMKLRFCLAIVARARSTFFESRS